MIELNKIIYKTLDDLNINAYPIVAPENTLLPFVIYERSLSSEETRDGRSFNNNIVTIYILSEDYKETLTLLNSIDNSFINLKGTVLYSFIHHSKLISVDEIFESGVYIQKVVYEIKTSA